jgi:hypothetical protein
MRSMRRWIGLALLAPMLVLVVAASRSIGLRCRMTGMVSADTCCPQAAPSDAPAQSSLAEPGCCERVVIAIDKPAATHDQEDAHGAAVSLSSGVLVSEITGQLPRERAVRASADSSHVVRPPLRLLKRSFLI